MQKCSTDEIQIRPPRTNGCMMHCQKYSINYVLSSIFIIVKKMYTVCKNKYEYTLQEHHDHLNPFWKKNEFILHSVTISNEELD